MTVIDIKALSKKLRRNAPGLLVQTGDNDPFNVNVARRVALAEWFGKVWDRFGFGAGTHLRRVHYRLVPQAEPVLMANGAPYENTQECWQAPIWAGRDARYLGLVNMSDFSDQRNGETVLNDAEEASDASLDIIEANSFELPAPPKLQLTPPTILQPYNIEIIAEKSTIDDVLHPLGEEYGVRVTSCSGDVSLTRCFEIVQRAQAAEGRPTSVFYISDFDPGGMNMPVAAARKIEFIVRTDDLDVDIQLMPIVLTHDQCVEYRLPRTPLKDTERRAAAFEDRFGAGATELYALEALHPELLREILVENIERYYDTTLTDRISEIESDFDPEVDEVNNAALASYAGQLDELQADFDRLKEPAEGDEHPDPLCASTRDYVTQLDRFKDHQGKKVTLSKRHRPPDPVLAAAAAARAKAAALNDNAVTAPANEAQS
jgi:hypothetical protein